MASTAVAVHLNLGLSLSDFGLPDKSGDYNRIFEGTGIYPSVLFRKSPTISFETAFFLCPSCPGSGYQPEELIILCMLFLTSDLYLMKEDTDW